MRALSTALLLVALAAPAAADDPTVITLALGEQKTSLGIMPRCDDLEVVHITADGRGVKGARPGETLCSFDTSGGGGARRVYRVVVLAPKGGEGGAERGSNAAQN